MPAESFKTSQDAFICNIYSILRVLFHPCTGGCFVPCVQCFYTKFGLCTRSQNENWPPIPKGKYAALSLLGVIGEHRRSLVGDAGS